MRHRETPLPTPPDRHPYFRAKVLGSEVVFRTPSLHTAGKLLQAVPQERQARLFEVLRVVSGGQPILAAVQAAPGVLELLAALLGLAWADPVLEIEAGKWDGASDPASYGARVHEELHEAGWKLAQVLRGGIAIAKQVALSLELDQAVREEAAFFLPTRVPKNEKSSKPSAPSSADDQALSES